MKAHPHWLIEFLATSSILKLFIFTSIQYVYVCTVSNVIAGSAVHICNKNIFPADFYHVFMFEKGFSCHFKIYMYKHTQLHYSECIQSKGFCMLVNLVMSF